jgi:hypothetical protein
MIKGRVVLEEENGRLCAAKKTDDEERGLLCYYFDISLIYPLYLVVIILTSPA